MARRWAFDNADRLDACGPALAQHLIEEAFPKMRWLMDQADVLAEIQGSTFTTPRSLSSDKHREIMLTVDDADPEHLDRLLSEAGKSPAPDFETRVRSRNAQRQANHH